MTEGKDLLSYINEVESLDEALQLYTEFKTKQREINWYEGDLLNALIGKFGSGVISACAEAGWGRKAHLEQVARVAKAFSAEERLSEISWSWFRAAYQASTRVKGETPFEILLKALDLDWKLSELNNYGKGIEEEPEFILVERCDVCETEYAMRRKRFIPEIVCCPVCALGDVMTPLGKFDRKV
jgi:hypothetical protein